MAFKNLANVELNPKRGSYEGLIESYVEKALDKASKFPDVESVGIPARICRDLSLKNQYRLAKHMILTCISWL